MPAGTRSRYPGAQPFADDALSRKLFHGRKAETTVLTHRILANRLTVLFARSGLGKTSLLNAGVAEQLRDEYLAPLAVRVSGSELGPLDSLYRGIEDACSHQGFEYVAGDRQSLWHFFKTAQFWHNDTLLTPVLILDQFEELFTLQSSEQRSHFLDELSCLVRGIRPSRESRSRPDLSDAPPAVKIMLSLREDFLACLEELSDRIPEILDQRFRLLPLTRSAASEAIVEPATVKHRDLATPPFDIDPWVQNMVLDFLAPRGSQLAVASASHVEPFQLQLICQHVEESAKRKRRGRESESVQVTPEDIGGTSKLHRILKSFYATQVGAIPSIFQRFKARRLCSQFLINPMGRRLRLEESEIRRLTGVKPQTLRILVDRRLLRVDQSADGNYYELSHDSLVVPVMESRRLWFVARALAVLTFAVVVLLITLYSAAMFASFVLARLFMDLAEHPIGTLVAALLGIALLVIAARIVLRHLREFWEMARRISRSRRVKTRISHKASPAR
jgi:conflict system STAND superfamily ATPase